MQRDEAIALLKEIMYTCGGIKEEGIMLMPPNADNALSRGYQLHIKASLTMDIVTCIREIVANHKLAMHEENENLIVIYRPLEPTG